MEVYLFKIYNIQFIYIILYVPYLNFVGTHPKFNIATEK